ncbi:MAG: glycosyltransferase [Sarcina sp.]
MINLILNIIICAIFFVYLYNTVITLFSWPKFKEKNIKNEKDSATFTILIPCHNEEAVIKDTLDAIELSYYNNNLFNVYVVADNCSDNTVKIVESIKATTNINLDYIEVKGGSKPKALNLAVNYLKMNNKWTNDNIVILDSDNIMSRTLLKTFNSYYLLGNKLMQCKIKSKNDKSFIARGFTSSFNAMNEGFQLARNRIGLSASLSGTGFSIDRKVWDDVGFDNCDTLTEDLEFAVLSILKGYCVKFIYQDYVLNENLDEFKPSVTQRVRWCRGHVQVAMKLNKRILKSFIKKPNIQLFDSFLFLNTPSRAVLYLACSVSTGIEAFRSDLLVVPKIILLVIFIYNLAFILHCNRYNLKYLIPHIFFALCMYFIIIYGFFTHKNTKWAKTVTNSL